MSKFFDFSRMNIIISTFIIISFIVGFLFQENSSGGAIDFAHYYHNFQLFYGNNFFKVDWFKYESSSLPLYYFVTYFFYNPDNLILLQIFNLLLSFLCVFIFYIILKNHLRLNNSLALLLSSSILLSPYFRTSTYWMMEENFPILMTLITIYFYFNLKNKFNYFFLLSAIFFSVCAFFSRQNYIIISLGLFLLIFDWKSIVSKKNFLIIFTYIICFLPSIYFFIVWKGLLPPLLVEQDRTLIFNFQNIPYIMNILLIYIFPFIYFDRQKILIFFSQNKILIILFLIFYLLLFYNFTPLSFGGGAINKLLFMVSSGFVLKYLTLVFSLISIIVFFTLFRDNKFILIYFLLNTLLFSTITPVWQEYFDPISLIFILLFGNKVNFSINSNRFAYSLIFYLTFFLGASIIDQYYLFNS
jgi:hypothetical protein